MHQLMHVGVRLTNICSLFAILRNSHFIWQANNFNIFFPVPATAYAMPPMQFIDRHNWKFTACIRTKYYIVISSQIENEAVSTANAFMLSLFFSRPLSIYYSCAGLHIPRKSGAEKNLPKIKYHIRTVANAHAERVRKIIWSIKNWWLIHTPGYTSTFHSKNCIFRNSVRKNSFIFSISTDEREKISRKKIE